MPEILPLSWSQPNPDQPTLHAASPSCADGGLSIRFEDGQWWASWDTSLPTEEDPELLKQAAQAFHDDWLSQFLASEEKHSPKDLGHRLKASEKKNAKLSRDLKAARKRVVELEQRIEDAVEAVSETAPSYKHHLTAAMSALGRDFEDPDWELPNVAKRSDALQAQVNAAEARLMGMDLLRDALQACHATSQAALEGAGQEKHALQQVMECTRSVIEDLDEFDYPSVVTMAMRSLEWVFHQPEDNKFGYHEAVDTVYGLVHYRINQVKEDGHSFLVGNTKFTEHATVRDAKIHAEMMNREMLQKAFLPHIRVVPKHDLDVAPLRAGRDCLRGADHLRALKDMSEAELKGRNARIELLIADIQADCEHSDLGQDIALVGGPVAAQLHHAVHRHDLGAAYDFLVGRLGGQDRWSVLDFDGNSRSEGWECRLLSKDGQVVTSAAGRNGSQVSAARAMVMAVLWAMALETRQTLGAREKQSEPA
jgi:hypothetical protein